MPAMNPRTHQELHCWLSANLGVQGEEVPEDKDPMVDILMADVPARLALPRNKTVAKISTNLWQMPTSIPPTQKGVENCYCMPQCGHEHLVEVANHSLGLHLRSRTRKNLFCGAGRLIPWGGSRPVQGASPTGIPSRICNPILRGEGSLCIAGGLRCHRLGCVYDGCGHSHVL